MFLRLSLLSLLSAGILWSTGCADSSSEAKVGGEVRVRIPWLDGKGGLQLQEVELKDLENLEEVSGAHARFFYAPKISEQGLSGASPKAQFVRTQSGLYVPADELSQQMAVVYAHLQNLRSLDEKVGLKGLLTYPRSVGISVRLRKQDGQLWTDNSFYDGSSDALLLVPNRKGQWPLAVNPGVMAHEHFHSIFYHLLIDPLLDEGVLTLKLRTSVHSEKKIRREFSQTSGLEGEKTEEELQEKRRTPRRGELEQMDLTTEIYNTAFVKVLNEGLADVWGWIYSGHPNFLQRSFTHIGTQRSLKLQSKQGGFSESVIFREDVRGCLRSTNPDGCVNNYAYMPGTELSRALRTIFLGNAKDHSRSGELARERLALRIVAALPRLAQGLRQSTLEKPMDLVQALRLILSVEELSTEEREAAKAWIKDFGDGEQVEEGEAVDALEISEEAKP